MIASGWLKSTAPNTGKTEIILAVNAFAGWKHKGVTMGACSSLPAVVKRLTLQSDNPLCLDEIATKVSVDQEKSKKIKDIVHMCANGSTREVCGKSEEPLTSFIGTANIVVNEVRPPRSLDMSHCAVEWKARLWECGEGGSSHLTSCVHPHGV